MYFARAFTRLRVTRYHGSTSAVIALGSCDVSHALEVCRWRVIAHHSVDIQLFLGKLE